MEKEKEKLTLLTRFGKNYQGVIANFICDYIRDCKKVGLDDDYILRKNIGSEITSVPIAEAAWYYYEKRYQKEKQWDRESVFLEFFNYITNNGEFIDYGDPGEELQAAIIYYVAWENLSDEKKQKIKNKNGEYWQKESMKGKEPTQPQIDNLLMYGKKKGIDYNDRFEASEILSNLWKK